MQPCTQYQSIINAAQIIRTSNDRHQMWMKYIEMHTSVERIFLDQGKGYGELLAMETAVNSGSTAPAKGRSGPVVAATATHVVSMRNRWVGKSGRIRREGMGKRVNFCARSVVTCDSYIDTDEIMVPHNVVARLTYPVSACLLSVRADTRLRLYTPSTSFI